MHSVDLGRRGELAGVVIGVVKFGAALVDVVLKYFCVGVTRNRWMKLLRSQSTMISVDEYPRSATSTHLDSGPPSLAESANTMRTIEMPCSRGPVEAIEKAAGRLSKTP